MTEVKTSFKLFFQGLNPFFSPAMRIARIQRAIRKGLKEEEIEAKEKKALYKDIEIGLIEGVIGEFKKYTEEEGKELEFLSKALSDLADLEGVQIKDLQNVILKIKDKKNRLQKDNPARKEYEIALKETANILEQFGFDLQKQFEKVQQFDSTSIQNMFHGDKSAMFSEIMHLTDPFNLRMEARKVRKQTKKSAGDSSRPKSLLNDLKVLHETLRKYLKHVELLFQDMMIIIYMVREGISEQNHKILHDLENLQFPEQQKVVKLNDDLMKQVNNSIKSNVNKINSIILIERDAMGVAV